MSCASLLTQSQVALENRTLRFSLDGPALVYDYDVCVQRILWCVKTELRRDRYDLTDPVVRKTLIDMGFVARVRPKVP